MRTESRWLVQTGASLIAEWILEWKAERTYAVLMLLRLSPVMGHLRFIRYL